MKKFLLTTTALLFLLGIQAQAQSFEFRYQGQTLADGATVTIAAAENDFGELACETNPSSNPTNGLMLQLLNGFTSNVKATLQITYNSLNATVLQWCMGGECKPVNGSETFTKTFMVEGGEQVHFDALNIQQKGYLLATLSATVGLETHQVTIQCTNGESAGIGQLMSGDLRENKFFDLNGRSIGKPQAPGVYVVSDGRHTKKAIIK